MFIHFRSPCRSSIGWRRPTGCLALLVIFRTRATNYRALLRKMTYKVKASYGSSPPSVRCSMKRVFGSWYTFLGIDTIAQYVSWHEEGVRQVVRICCSFLQRVAVCCSVWQCVAACGSVLQRVAVCCSSVLQHIAVCCSVSKVSTTFIFNSPFSSDLLF